MSGLEIARAVMTAFRFVSRPVKWLYDLRLLVHKARIDVEDRPRHLMERRLRRLEKELEGEKDPERRRGLEREVKKARDELIGYDIEVSERTLKRAKLPPLDGLAEIGRQRLAAGSTSVKQNDRIGAKNGQGDDAVC